MTWIDVAIVALTLFFAVAGYQRGFVVGAASLVGFAGGAWLGTRIGPELLSEGSASPYAPMFGLLGAVFAGALVAAGLEGIASVFRDAFDDSPFAVLDGILGSVLSGALALGLAWIFGVIALQTPGARELREDVQRSEILQRLNDALPSDKVLNALATFDPSPRVDGPEVDVPAPREKIARDPQVVEAGRSVVKITGSACGLGVEGSGWVARGNLVVTNAHVISGQDDTDVQLRGEGEKLDATAVAFDVKNDIAVLRVDGLDADPLKLSPDVEVGEAGASLGFPLNGPYKVRAARIGRTRNVISQDAYGRGPVTRKITAFRGTVQPGNSGGPLVDAQGRVAATVFAKSTDSNGPEGGYAVPLSVVRETLAGVRGPVDTGPCVE